MANSFDLPVLIDLLCRTGSDPVLQDLLEIDEPRLKRLRQVAARDTASSRSFPKLGVEFAFGTSKMSPSIPTPQGVKYEIRLDTVFLFQKVKGRPNQYQGDLPAGLTFGLSFDDVQKLLGEPVERRDFRTYREPDFISKRLKYDSGEYWYWCEFDQSDLLYLVALVGYCYGADK